MALAVSFGFGMMQAEDMEELRARAEAGDAEAMNYLGYLLMSEQNDSLRNPGAGLTWIMKAAATGDAKAASNLGWLFIEGDIVEQDFNEGAKWLQVASSKGLPVAMSLLGDLYRDGKGMPTDSVVADSLYREAFERGLADAGFKLYSLNESFYQGLTPERQVEEGIYYYLRSAPSEGVKLFYLAAEQDDVRAKALLGDAYTRARGVPYDHTLSLKYYAEAAYGGNPSAQFVVAELLDIFPDALSRIPGLPEMPADAQYWYEKAADAGVGDADTANRLLFE